MDHLAQDRLLALAFDGERIDEVEAAHVDMCAQCRANLSTLSQLAAELRIAKASRPSQAALQGYYHFFAKRTAPRLGEWWQRLTASLALDSRQIPAAQGVRSAQAGGYRLLFTTPRADIELMIAGDGEDRRLDGELLPLQVGDEVAPALVQVLSVVAGGPTYEAECDADGRFHLTGVVPGLYSLIIAPASGALLSIDELEIA